MDFGNGEHFIINYTGEYFIRPVILEPYKGNPFFFVIVETDDIGIEYLGSFKPGTIIFVDLLFPCPCYLAARLNVNRRGKR